LYLRIPIGTLFNTKNAPIPLGAIRFFKDTLLQWKRAEQQYKPEPSALLRFYLKKQIRLKFVKWLIVNHLNDRNSTKDYSPLFQDFDQEVRETEEWLQTHDPNRPKGFVRSEVARIDQQSTPKPSTAPISVKPSPMKVAARPSTGWDRSMYKTRVEQQIQSMTKK